MELKTIEEYYTLVMTNFLDGAIYPARKRFEQMSQKQRKAFFLYLSDECKVTADDPMYRYFFEMM